MSARKIRNKWWVDFRHDHVRYRKRSPLNTAEGAKLYELTLRGRLARGELLCPPRLVATVTFAEFAEEWFATYVRANNKPSEQETKAGILRRHLLPALGATRLDRLAVDQVERFKADLLSAGLSAKTVNNILGTLRTCLRTAVEWGRVASAPVVRPMKAPPRATDYLSEAEAGRLRTFALERRETYTMVLAALDTGMRLGELRALRWDDLDFESGVVSISHALSRTVESSTKSNKVRHVPMTDELARVLRTRTRASDRVFPSANGGVMSEDGASDLLARACIEAGLRRIAWHRLRHTFATRLVRRGQSLRAVQALLGHSTVTMTERYAHVAHAHLHEVINSLNSPATISGQRMGNGPVEAK